MQPAPFIYLSSPRGRRNTNESSPVVTWLGWMNKSQTHSNWKVSGQFRWTYFSVIRFIEQIAENYYYYYYSYYPQCRKLQRQKEPHCHGNSTEGTNQPTNESIEHRSQRSRTRLTLWNRTCVFAIQRAGNLPIPQAMKVNSVPLIESRVSSISG